MTNRLRYIDLQVNGFGGVDFNSDDLTGDQLHNACEHLQQDGAAAFLPTIITDNVDRMAARLAKIASLRNADPLVEAMVLGVHIEGPFISAAEGFVGAHPPAEVVAPNVDAMRKLLDAAAGLTRIVTLAPELDQRLQVTRLLADQDIVVAAGHCNPSIDELNAAIDAGLSMFTHLGNGCPQTIRRHDNVVERVLSVSDRLRISFIADGAHVPMFALRNYLRAAGLERCVIVSDAISAAALGPGRYSIGGVPTIVGDDQVPRAIDGGHFVGSATSIAQMVDKLRRELNLDDEQIEQLTVRGPRAILGPVDG